MIKPTWILVFCNAVFFSISSVLAESKEGLLSRQYIQDIIERNKINSLSDLLKEIPPTLLEDYTLVFDSHSRQNATHEAPRALVYNADGSFVMSFNGTGENLEIIEFQKDIARFRFTEIRFSSHEPIVERDPSSCKSCHGSDPRPNWEQYAHWPGVFGERPGKMSEKNSEKLSTFIEKTKSNSLYKHLPDLNSFEKRSSSFMDERKLPNVKLLLGLQKNNAKRLARIIGSTADYDSFKFLILGSIACHTGFNTGFTTPETFARFFPKEISIYQNLAYQFGFPLVVRDTGGNPRSLEPDTHYQNSVVNLFTYIFDQRGISTINWSLNFLNPNAAGQFSPGGGYMDSYLARALVERDPELKAFIQFKQGRYYETPVANCAELMKLSREALSKLPRNKLSVFGNPDLFPVTPLRDKVFAQRNNFLVTQKRCSGCHDGQGTAPFISFNWPERMSRQLSDRPMLCRELSRRVSLGPSHEQRMPPPSEPALSNEEKKAIQSYFDLICADATKKQNNIQTSSSH